MANSIIPLTGGTGGGGGGTSIHNDLTGLQGGAIGDYYHLTSNQAVSVGDPLISLAGDIMASTSGYILLGVP